jgi:hypothetical protein
MPPTLRRLSNAPAPGAFRGPDIRCWHSANERILDSRWMGCSEPKKLVA